MITTLQTFLTPKHTSRTQLFPLFSKKRNSIGFSFNHFLSPLCPHPGSRGHFSLDCGSYLPIGVSAFLASLTVYSIPAAGGVLLKRNQIPSLLCSEHPVPLSSGPTSPRVKGQGLTMPTGPSRMWDLPPCSPPCYTCCSQLC